VPDQSTARDHSYKFGIKQTGVDMDNHWL